MNDVQTFLNVIALLRDGVFLVLTVLHGDKAAVLQSRNGGLAIARHVSARWNGVHVLVDGLERHTRCSCLCMNSRKGLPPVRLWKVGQLVPRRGNRVVGLVTSSLLTGVVTVALALSGLGACVSTSSSGGASTSDSGVKVGLLDAGVDASPELPDGACPKFGTPECSVSTTGIETLSQATSSICAMQASLPLKAGGRGYVCLESAQCGGLTAIQTGSGADSFGVMLFNPTTGDLEEVGHGVGSPDVICQCSRSGSAAPCPELFFGEPCGLSPCTNDAGEDDAGTGGG